MKLPNLVKQFVELADSVQRGNRYVNGNEMETWVYVTISFYYAVLMDLAKYKVTVLQFLIIIYCSEPFCKNYPLNPFHCFLYCNNQIFMLWCWNNIKSGQSSVEQFCCPNVYQTHLNFKVFSPMNFNLMKIEDEGVWCVWLQFVIVVKIIFISVITRKCML